MWAFIGKWLVRGAIFAYGHKDEVIAAVSAIKTAKDRKRDDDAHDPTAPPADIDA